MAIVASAAVVFLFERRLKHVLGVCAIGGVVLGSLLAYVPAYSRARDWNILVRGAPSHYSLWKHCEVALGNPGYSMPALWYSVAIGLAGVFIFRIYKNQGGQPVPHRELIWFAAIVSGLSIIGCYLFLRILSYTTSAWYYLALICLIAAALDLIASVLCTAIWLRLVRLGFASAALIAAPFADWSAITERQTNVDVAARTVAARAAPGDLVIVTPWQLGIPFQRYYCGTAPWMTIPSIADHRVHRYDLMKAKMISQDPIDDLGRAIRFERNPPGDAARGGRDQRQIAFRSRHRFDGGGWGKMRDVGHGKAEVEARRIPHRGFADRDVGMHRKRRLHIGEDRDDVAPAVTALRVVLLLTPSS
jgi:hypothetical protein